jgi:hypothetical protein
MFLNAFIDITRPANTLSNNPSSDNPIHAVESGTEFKCPLSIKHLFNSPAQTQSPTTPENAESLYAGFKLPIEYLNETEVFCVSNIVTTDLELSRKGSDACLFTGVTTPNIYSAGCADVSEQTVESATIYEQIIQPTNIFAGEMTRDVQKKYTVNTQFLTQTQCVIKEMDEYISTMRSFMDSEMPVFSPNSQQFLEIWKDTKENANFLDKYSYLEWSILEHLNHSAEFLQVFSITNILSPLFSLLVPILLLIFPFVLLRLRCVEITIEQYIGTLRAIAKNHFIGKALSSDFSFHGIVYLLLMFGLYALQTYQNVNSCIRYYTNITKLNANLEYIRDHVKHSMRRMEVFTALHEKKETYREFCEEVKRHTVTLGELHKELSHITPFAISYRKSTNIGYMLKCYYQLYSNKTYEHSIRYSVGFGAYMDVLVGINNRLCAGQLGEARFIAEPRVVFSDQYYPTHSSDICIKNTCDLSQNMIITGVNASGKTTFIKTTAINILFTQQFGVGCYSSCDICPFTHIHSYLNIPDTSGRDSLFQAESRRCKEIIDAIGKNGSSTKERHFVIFDELYSGTNPDEATKAAVSLLRYLSSFNNVRFMLTTHYLKVCKKFRKSGKISNHKMCVKVDSSGGIEYLYKIKKGISKIQGGIEILKMMNYPEEILQDIRDE